MQDLKKEYRLRRSGEFRYVYRQKQAKVSSVAVLYFVATPNRPTRIGFVTGKKVGGAVQRNRARRLMKEVYRLHRHTLKEGFMLVLVGRAPLAKMSYKEAEKEIIRLWRRAGIQK